MAFTGTATLVAYQTGAAFRLPVVAKSGCDGQNQSDERAKDHRRPLIPYRFVSKVNEKKRYVLRENQDNGDSINIYEVKDNFCQKAEFKSNDVSMIKNILSNKWTYALFYFD